MKSISIVLFAALFTISGASLAAGACPEGHRGKCLQVPAPPAPPVPPAPPAPPAPPPLPAISAEVHAMCAGKKIGSELTVNPKRGVTMSGTCQQDNKGMYFELDSLHTES